MVVMEITTIRINPIKNGDDNNDDDNDNDHNDDNNET